jgi:hypothetical protein
VKKAVGNVDSIKVTRSELVLVNCVDEEQKHALEVAKLSTSEVTCIDLQSRVPAG